MEAPEVCCRIESHRQPLANNSKQSDAGVIEVTFSSQKSAGRSGAAVTRRQGKLILLSAMSNRVSAVMVVFYQLGSRRASSSMLTPEVGGELELLRRQSFQAGRASQLSGPWTQLLPSVIGGAGWCLGANHYLWPTKFAAAPSLFHVFRDFSRLYWRQRWIG